MKRSFKSMLGVTLLEIMLVLAIAAMVLVMSIRYYQSASTSQKVNATMQTIIAVMSAAESYYMANNNSYVGLTTTYLTGYMPGNVPPTTPWGGTITVGQTVTATSYQLALANIPSTATSSACPTLTALLKQDPRIGAVDVNCATITVNATS